MTPAEFYTNQFYTWEFRGRGWFVSDESVHLEPPFIPYFRHGLPEQYIDDGKRHTFMSKFVESFKGKKEIVQTQTLLDYETIEPYVYESDATLQALQIKLPKDRKLPPERMKALLIMLSYTASIISFEIIGTEKEIIVQFVCDEEYIDILETHVSAYFPQYAVIRTNTYVEDIIQAELSAAVIDFGLKHEFVRPLNTAKNFSIDPLLALLGVLERLGANEQAGMQILFQPAVNQWSESIIRSVTMPDKTSFFFDAPEAPQLAQEKVHSPLYGVTMRAFAQAEELDDAFDLLNKVSLTILNASKGTTNELIPLINVDYDFTTRISDIFNRQSHRLGMLLNVDELITFVHFPSESIASKKLFAASRKTKGVPEIARDKAYTLGLNQHNGSTTNVTVSMEDRLKHTHIIGATGTGKSTLIANLILQDINHGNGIVLFDPHGDLITDVIALVPKERIDDVVLIDPSDIGYPIGLNILQAHSDIEKEVLSSDLVASFRKHATSWGDQMNAVLGNAIQAMLETKDGGTVHDLRRFLLEKDFRQSILKNITDPSILYYWHKEFPILKTNSIGPIVTRLDTFLRPKSIRNMLIQKEGIDMEALCNSNKIILIKLSQGLIGTENSFLLGSLILSTIHQAVLRRQQTSIRTPLMVYIDEFQHFITPSIKDMLSGIRKYNVGLTLSHQDLQQLQREDSELVNSIMGNINTRIVFRVGEPDAKKLQDGFTGFDFTDLQNLGRGEAVVRIEQPQYDCSLDTVPLQHISQEEKENSVEQVQNYCREEYATPRAEVEELLAQSFAQTQDEPPKKEKPSEKPRQEPVKTEPYKETSEPIPPVEPPKEKPQGREDADVSAHRYFQNLVKRMAESRGYTATLEVQLPGGSGQVDVVLAKEGKRIAIEISNTTEAEWEMHNIEKCISAKYDMVVSLSGDPKQLEKIKKKCSAGIANFNSYPVFFFTIDALFAHFDASIPQTAPQENMMKGFRVNVTYDSISNEEMDRKRAAVTKAVMESRRKGKK